MSKVKVLPPPPYVELAIAEKVLRDIARRSGYAIRKRRSPIQKELTGDGYCIINAQTNSIVAGADGIGRDGCDWSLSDVADYFKFDSDNTPWQRTVIQSILEGKVK